MEWREYPVDLLDRITGAIKAKGRWDDAAVLKAFEIARAAPADYARRWLELDDDLNPTWVEPREGVG